MHAVAAAALALALLVAGCTSPGANSTGTPTNSTQTATSAPAKVDVEILRPLTCDTAQSRDPPAAGGFHLKDKVTFEREWRKACTSPHSSPPPDVPVVDFAKEQVLLYAWGEKPSGGYAVAIIGATMKAGELEVTVRRADPGNCPAITVITYPASAVVIEKVEAKSVKWTFEEKVQQC